MNHDWRLAEDSETSMDVSFGQVETISSAHHDVTPCCLNQEFADIPNCRSLANIGPEVTLETPRTLVLKDLEPFTFLYLVVRRATLSARPEPIMLDYSVRLRIPFPIFKSSNYLAALLIHLQVQQVLLSPKGWHMYTRQP